MAFKQDTVTVNLYDGSNFSRLRQRVTSSKTSFVSAESESAVISDLQQIQHSDKPQISAKSKKNLKIGA